MFWILFFTYIFAVIGAWIFYSVIRIHTTRYAKFSKHIPFWFRLMFIMMIVLTILGFVVLFFQFFADVGEGLFGGNSDAPRTTQSDIQILEFPDDEW